jgi:hypothetical protein
VGDKDHDRENEYSPNPEFNRRIPPEHPEAERARLYRQHRAAGSLETYFAMYPLDRPWSYGLTAEEIAALEGRQLPPRGRDDGNDR